MKPKFIYLLTIALVALLSCRDAEKEEATKPAQEQKIDYAAFDKKVADIRGFYEAHEAEDLDALSAVLSDTLKWSPPNNTENHWFGKKEMLATLKSYHDTYDNIRFEEGIHIPGGTGIGYWSGSIFPEEAAHYSPVTIRVYGTWTATHVESGQEVGTKFFSMITFNDAGKIIQASDYFDLSSLIPEE